jgi:uncharacterized membrane protein YfcA
VLDWTDAWLALGGAIAGMINAIAGGGSALTFPLLLFAGLDAQVANGTNRLAILVQSVSAVGSFHQQGVRPWRLAMTAVAPALVGALIGSLLATILPPLALERLFGVVFLGLAVMMMLRPSVVVPEPIPDVAPHAPSTKGALALFGIGIYGGLFQAGVGIPLLIVVVHTLNVGLVRGNAIKVFLVMTYTTLALAVFAWQGQIDWHRGATLAVGGIFGSIIGARMTVRGGATLVKRVVLVALLVAAARTLGLIG